MRKFFSIFLVFAALLVSGSVWGATVSNVKYIDADGNEQTCPSATVVANSSSAVTWNAGWYIVQGNNISLSKGAICSGAVHLILADGATLTTTGINDTSKSAGIQVTGSDNSLTIYGQSNQSGKLIANGGPSCAGIGGNIQKEGNNITINGGNVTATGGDYAAAIGGGTDSNGCYIYINGGNVIATGSHGAGIGGGDEGSARYIYINGGTVTASVVTGTGQGIGRGSSDEGSTRDIFVNNALSLKAGSSAATATSKTIPANNNVVSLIASCKYISITETIKKYTRPSLTSTIGTICLPGDVVQSGKPANTTFYEIYGKEGIRAYFSEVAAETTLVAGKAYVFSTTESSLTWKYATTTVSNPTTGSSANGFIGTFVDLAPGSSVLSGKQIIAENKIWSVGPGTYMNKYRAYLDWNNIPDKSPAGAPGRLLSFDKASDPTNIESWIEVPSCETYKFIQDGKLYIMRGQHIYNLQGQLVK